MSQAPQEGHEAAAAANALLPQNQRPRSPLRGQHKEISVQGGHGSNYLRGPFTFNFYVDQMPTISFFKNTLHYPGGYVPQRHCYRFDNLVTCDHSENRIDVRVTCFNVGRERENNFRELYFVCREPQLLIDWLVANLEEYIPEPVVTEHGEYAETTDSRIIGADKKVGRYWRVLQPSPPPTPPLQPNLHIQHNRFCLSLSSG